MITSTATRLGRVRVLVALTTSALALTGLAACGNSDSSDGTTGTAGSKKMTIQFINPLPSYPAWRKIGDCMKDEATAKGTTLIESGPTGQALDASVMIQQVQQATANKRDAIITFPASDGFAPALKQAQSKGITTGTLYGPDGPDSGADYNIGPDWNAIGALLVDAVAALPGKHVLGLVAQGNTGVGKFWTDGVKAAVAKTDNVTIAGEVYTGDDSSKALPQVNALLTAHPDVTDIVTHMGTTNPGAVAAIKSHHLEGKTFLVAGGHDNGGEEAVKDGLAKLILMQDVCTLGKQMVDGVIDLHNGKQAPKVPVKLAVIPGDQMQAYLDKGWV